MQGSMASSAWAGKWDEGREEIAGSKSIYCWQNLANVHQESSWLIFAGQISEHGIFLMMLYQTLSCINFAYDSSLICYYIYHDTCFIMCHSFSTCIKTTKVQHSWSHLDRRFQHRSSAEVLPVYILPIRSYQAKASSRLKVSSAWSQVCSFLFLQYLAVIAVQLISWNDWSRWNSQGFKPWSICDTLHTLKLRWCFIDLSSCKWLQLWTKRACCQRHMSISQRCFTGPEIGVWILCQFGQATGTGQLKYNILKDICEFADTAQTSPKHLNHACSGSSPLVDQFAARDLWRYVTVRRICRTVLNCHLTHWIKSLFGLTWSKVAKKHHAQSGLSQSRFQQSMSLNEIEPWSPCKAKAELVPFSNIFSCHMPSNFTASKSIDVEPFWVWQ